jgi:iron complex outermembrane receptor protein
MQKTALAGVASAIAIVASSNAIAQTNETHADSDIIVTATRESTLLSKTPVAITAISGDGLRSKGIANPANLGEQVPNLSIDRTNGLQITIRGVTSTDGTERAIRPPLSCWTASISRGLRRPMSASSTSTISKS